MSTGKIRAAGNWIDAGSGCVATRQKKKFNATYAYCMESLISSFYTTSRQHQHVRRGELWCVSCCTPFSPSVTSYSFPPPHRCKKICIQNILRQFHGKKLFGEKKNGGKKGVLRCAVYKRNFHVFTPGSSSFFPNIWLVFKKRGQDSSLSILFGRRKKKEPREKFCWFDVIVNQATTSR